ncbi:MAG: toprim domain-containing protein [Saprospiraceae bacterium]|nr:toprim domain-containing protein [Saprospiraceae bacterium]
MVGQVQPTKYSPYTAPMVLHQSMKEAIKSLPDLEEIILFFDGDEAGRAALMKYRESLPQIKPGIKISHVETPDGEDPNSLTISHSPRYWII